MSKLEEIIQNAEEILIVSGEGEIGTEEEYEGKRSLRAIKTRLTKEKCQGDRWAYVLIDDERYDF